MRKRQKSEEEKLQKQGGEKTYKKGKRNYEE